MAGPYSTEVAFDVELPPIESILLKLQEVTGLQFGYKNVGEEGDCWHLVDHVTSMEIDLMVHKKSYAIFSFPFNVRSQQPDMNSYLFESVLFALVQLGGNSEETLEVWAGEPWSTAKWRWNPKHIDGRGRN